MSKHPTTIRLDEKLYKQTVREAKKAGLTFSGVVHILLRAFTEGDVDIGVAKYPKKYLEALDKEAKELRRLHRQGKVKSYTSAKALMDDILGE
jgi:hypothetical protein